MRIEDYFRDKNRKDSRLLARIRSHFGTERERGVTIIKVHIIGESVSEALVDMSESSVQHSLLFYAYRSKIIFHMQGGLW